MRNGRIKSDYIDASKFKSAVIKEFLHILLEYSLIELKVSRQLQIILQAGNVSSSDRRLEFFKHAFSLRIRCGTVLFLFRDTLLKTFL